jgi:hypothetical protein
LNRKVDFNTKHNSLWIDLAFLRALYCTRFVHLRVLFLVQSRGLRQGDPLSPYLFLICVKILSSVLNRAEETGVITRVPTSKNGSRLSHLFFANDNLLFCKANLVEWRRLSRILEKYEVVSGQKLNKDKTSIFFSVATLIMKKRRRLLDFQYCKPLRNMKNIWGFQLWWESRGQRLLKQYEIKFGIDCKIRKQNFCLKRVRRYY